MRIYVLIMAGGEGKRFWPLGRKSKPKQFLSLIGDRTMLRHTVDRVLPIVPIGNVLIVTVRRYAEQTLIQIPELPKQNLILEPVGKNTCACIALGAAHLSSVDPEAAMLVLPSDHVVGDEEAFNKAVMVGEKVLDTKLPSGASPLVTFGLKPKSPETGYGYIRSGELISKIDAHEVRMVSEFTEKPDIEKARSYLEEGGYYWNSGMFMWKAKRVLEEIKMTLAEWRTSLTELEEGIGGDGAEGAIENFYSTVEDGSIDKLLLEKSTDTVVIPVDYPWSDLGSWEALDVYLRRDASENVMLGDGISVDSSGCLVIGGDKPVGIVGLRNVIVVDTGDAILVLDKSKSQSVKELVEILEKEWSDVV
ncbi:MAG: mannose-1-phosphate guanylyltransferase [Thermodesulfobacteriota bacterium]